MAQKKIRPIYTEVGKIKPLGKTRRVKKSEARPWRPFRIGTYRLRERLKKPDELIVHRRPTGRPDVAVDPREAMAISKTRVRGTLPERIVYKKFVSTRRWIYFDFQSSLMGGRLQLGGIVADFILPDYRVIIRVQGPTHKTQVGTFKDKQQAQLLADMGYTVYDLDENICYDPMRLEEWFRRYIDKLPSVGGRMAISGLPSAGTVVFLATGEMNFAWTLQEHQRVERLEDMIINVQRDLDRIQAGRVITVNGLSDINTNLGLVQAGEFRVGNSKQPGSGFTGVRMGFPPFRYGGEDWHVVGVNNDVLQFGLSATTGKAIAGAGGVMLSEDGILFNISGEFGFPQDAIVWNEGPEYTWDTLRGSIDYNVETNPSGPYQGNHGSMDLYLRRTLNGMSATDGYDSAQMSFTVQSKNHYSQMSLNANNNSGYEDYTYFEVSVAALTQLRIEKVNTNPHSQVIINDSKGNVDFVVHGDAVDYLINVDGSLDLVNMEYLAMHEYIDFEGNSAHPATPGAGYLRMFVDSDEDTVFAKPDHGHSMSMIPLQYDFDNSSFSNTTAWQTMGEITIPAGTMTAKTVLEWNGDYYFYNNAGTYNIYTRADVYDGTTTTYYPNSTGIQDGVTASTNDRPYPLRLWWVNQNSTSSNQLRLHNWEIDVQIHSGSMSWNTASNNIRIRIQMRMSAASSAFHLNPSFNRIYMYADDHN